MTSSRHVLGLFAVDDTLGAVLLNLLQLLVAQLIATGLKRAQTCTYMFEVFAALNLTGTVQ